LLHDGCSLGIPVCYLSELHCHQVLHLQRIATGRTVGLIILRERENCRCMKLRNNSREDTVFESGTYVYTILN
jgi:hypothetical protein